MSLQKEFNFGITLDEHFYLDRHISKFLKDTEKVKTIHAITSTKTSNRIIVILQTRLLQQFIY